MNIEVTQETFDLIFESMNWQKTENLESANKHYYLNSDLDQKGILIHNFVGDIVQYYLTDINA